MMLYAVYNWLLCFKKLHALCAKPCMHKLSTKNVTYQFAYSSFALLLLLSPLSFFLVLPSSSVSPLQPSFSFLPSLASVACSLHWLTLELPLCTYQPLSGLEGLAGGGSFPVWMAALSTSPWFVPLG